MNSIDKMKEGQLPPQEEFNSKLRNETCSDADYGRAQEVWKEFGFQNFQEYHEHYLKCIFYIVSLISPLLFQ